jgi:hypothetical protein
LGFAGEAGGTAAFILNNVARSIQSLTPFVSVLADVLGTAVDAYGRIVSAMTDFINRNEWLQKELSGFANAFVNTSRVIGDVASGVFGGIGDLISGTFSGDLSSIKNGISKLADAVSKPFLDLHQAITKGFTDAEDFQMGFGVKIKGANAEAGLQVGKSLADVRAGMSGANGAGGIDSVKAGIAGVEGDMKASRNFTLHIEKLIETQNISTTMVTESAGKIKDLIAAALMDAVRDTEVAY